ncbi:MAG: hypothetical protein ACREID_07985, partial [Planctomycetota bacterium]
MRRRFASMVAAWALLAGCETTPTQDGYEQQLRNKDGVIEGQELKMNELAEENGKLARRVAELEARVARERSAEQIVEEAKGEISEHVREILEKFRGDADIQVEAAPGGYRFVLREAVLFPSGSADLTDKGREALRRVAE